jgi:hypothetical protein
LTTNIQLSQTTTEVTAEGESSIYD